MANPAIRTQSYQIEGVSKIRQLEFVQFQGGMTVTDDVYQIGLADYSDIQNMRPRRPGFEKRRGCIQLNTVPYGSTGGGIISMFQMSKGKFDSVETFAQMSNGDIVKFSTNPPTPGTTLGSIVHTSDSPSTMSPASWTVVGDILVYADGTGTPYFYPGLLSSVQALVVYKGSLASPAISSIPIIPIIGEDYSFQVRDGLSSTYATLSSVTTLAAFDAIFILTDCQATALTFTMISPNATTSVSQMHYWNGAWTSVGSAFDDGTILSGATLGQSGVMSWDIPSDARPNYMFGKSGYWLRLSLASGALDPSVTVSSVTYSSPFTKMKNIWDGIPLGGVEAYIYVAATKTYESYAASSITMDAILAADKLYVSTIFPATGLYIDPGAIPNEATATISIKYHNGLSFQAVMAFEDGTIVDGKSLAKAGWVTFAHPSDEKPIMFQSASYYLSWYEISFTAPMTEEMSIYVESIPWLDIADHGIFYNACVWKNRVSYACSELPGYIICSAKDFPQSLNGDDYFIKDVGDGRLNKVVAQAPFRNELLVWQEEKGTDGGCLTLLEGYDPLTIGKLLLSVKFGTFSQKSVCVVDEDVVTFNLQIQGDGTYAKSPDIKTAAFFLSRYGICMTDGRGGVTLISNPSVQIYFDTTNAKCIRRGYENEHWINHDSTHKILRIGLCTGDTAIHPNVFLVYDYRSGYFSHDVLTYPLSAHIEVEPASGNTPIAQIGGGAADGTVYLLNSGSNDVSTAIDASVTMEFDGHGHILHLEEVVLRLSGPCIIYTYRDGVLDKTIPVS